MSPVGWWSRNAWSSRSDLSRCRGTYHKFVKKKIFKKFWTCRAQRRGPQSSWDRWRTVPRMFRRCRVFHRGRQILAPGPLCTGPWQWQAVTRDTQWSPPAPVVECLGCGVSAPEPRPLGQDLLELLRGAARDQGPDQGQGVGIEVGLEKIYLSALKMLWLSVNTVAMRESRTLTAKAVPQAKGWVRYSSVSGSSSSSSGSMNWTLESFTSSVMMGMHAPKQVPRLCNTIALPRGLVTSLGAGS